jgi:hypothetical protein
MKSLQEKSQVNPDYIKGLSGSEAAQRKKEIERGSKTGSDDPSAYKDNRFKTDFTSDGERKKTKPSKHTKTFKRMFGELDDVLEEDLESDDLFEEDFNFLNDLSLLREFIEEILSEKKKDSNVTTALKNKAEKAGAPVGALRAIYNKGLAAWRTGHRPGASPHQWAMARVNSVLSGGPARKVDAAQWEKIKKHRGKKRKKKKD